jgi:hypothetical protein
MGMGGSTVERATPDPCLVLNEAIQNYTLTLNLVKEKKS